MVICSRRHRLNSRGAGNTFQFSMPQFLFPPGLLVCSQLKAESGRKRVAQFHLRPELQLQEYICLQLLLLLLLLLLSLIVFKWTVCKVNITCKHNLGMKEIPLRTETKKEDVM